MPWIDAYHLKSSLAEVLSECLSVLNNGSVIFTRLMDPRNRVAYYEAADLAQDYLECESAAWEAAISRRMLWSTAD